MHLAVISSEGHKPNAIESTIQHHSKSNATLVVLQVWGSAVGSVLAGVLEVRSSLLHTSQSFTDTEMHGGA